MVYAMRSNAFVLLLAATVLAGCGDSDALSRNFGVARDAPTTTASAPLLPLSVPPTLSDRPLRPGATATPVLRDPSGSAAATAAGASSGQQALLDAAGGGIAAPTDIRQQIDEDTRLVRTSPQFADELMSWSPQPGAPTVFQPAKKGWLSRIF